MRSWLVFIYKNFGIFYWNNLNCGIKYLNVQMIFKDVLKVSHISSKLLTNQNLRTQK